MSEMRAIKIEELDKVAGGVLTMIRSDEDVVIREEPGLDGRILATLPNGTKLETNGTKTVKDGITWYMVHLASGSDDAWIDGSRIVL